MSPCPVIKLPAPVMPLAEAVRSVERELREMGRLAERLQVLLSPFLLAASSDQLARIEEVQGLDRLTQHLKGLAEFLDAVAVQLPPQWSIDAGEAARTVVLAELAGRLLGHQAAGLGSLPGLCELFDD